MPEKWNNSEIAALLYRIADILEIQGEIVFKIVAYRRAADAIEHLGRNIRDIWQNDPKNLRAIQGVGEAIADKIDELLRTGKLAYYEKISKDVPDGVLELLTIPDVGPKTVARLWKELKITGVDKLEKAARAGKLRTLKGFGAKSEEKILAGIEAQRRKKSFTRISTRRGIPIRTGNRRHDARGVQQRDSEYRICRFAPPDEANHRRP